MTSKYRRIVLKLSGEALAGKGGFGIDHQTVLPICYSIKNCVELGAQVGIVGGGGNFWRGRTSGKMDHTRADHMGMMATVINALALEDALEEVGVPARVQTAIPIQTVAEPYSRDEAVRHMEAGRVVVFGTAALRAVEVGADIVLKATMVDGVYDKDPHKHPDARRYDTVSFSQVLTQQLSVMDMTAASLCRDNGLPVLVFDLSDPENICRAVRGENIGTIVKEV